MSSIEKIIAKMRQSPAGISFSDLCKVCDHYFGMPRQTKGSHRIYKTPWQGDPRVNIQNKSGKAKPYQVRQILEAINKIEKNNGDQ
ncbi:MAG: toxin HicA [Cyanobacteria bacterium J06635_15]